MRVYIKGMKMPSVCDECWALDESGDYPMCRITGETRGYNFRVYEKRMDKCPLIELPNHGDLIEKPILIDELAISEEPDDCSGCASYNSYDDFCCRSFDFQNMCKSIRTAPVVISAERNEHE